MIVQLSPTKTILLEFSLEIYWNQQIDLERIDTFAKLWHPTHEHDILVMGSVPLIEIIFSSTKLLHVLLGYLIPMYFIIFCYRYKQNIFSVMLLLSRGTSLNCVGRYYTRQPCCSPPGRSAVCWSFWCFCRITLSASLTILAFLSWYLNLLFLFLVFLCWWIL